MTTGIEQVQRGRDAVRIGVDVGGTNTDAVVVDGQRVLSGSKAPTTENVSTGIVRAISAALAESKVAATAIERVMIGTTHFTNAFVERRGLLPVGIIRIALRHTLARRALRGGDSQFRLSLKCDACLT